MTETAKHMESKYDDITISRNEILTLCVGRCGVFTGNEYFATIMNEHEIDKKGNLSLHSNKDKSNPYFKHKRKTNQYIPRALFIDIDNTSINTIRSSWLGSLLNSDNMIDSGYNDPSIIYPAGYAHGLDIIDNVTDKIRREIEMCHHFEGINLIHSITGGWGSGFASLLLSSLTDDYPKRSRISMSIFPSIIGSSYSWYGPRGPTLHSHHNGNIEIYNAVLAINELMDSIDLTAIIDNGCLLRTVQEHCNLSNPTYNDMNWISSLVLSGITSPIRFVSEPKLCSNLKRMDMHFRLFPKLRFVSISHSPWFAKNESIFNDDYTKIVQESVSNDVSNVKMEDGKILSYAMFYRGNNSRAIDKINKYSSSFYDEYCDDFVAWIPQPFQSCFIVDGGFECYGSIIPLMTTSVINQTAIKSIFQRISAWFSKIYRQKNHLHLYKQEGMDAFEFDEADRNIRDLVTNYQDTQDAVVECEEDESEEDDSSEEDEEDESEEDSY